MFYLRSYQPNKYRYPQLELSPSVIGAAVTEALAYHGVPTNRRPPPHHLYTSLIPVVLFSTDDAILQL